MKKLVAVLATLCLGFGFGFGGNVFAASPESLVDADENIKWEVIETPLNEDVAPSDETFGLSELPDYGPFTDQRPTEVWDISKKGAYPFNGSSRGSTLYTNYKFKGKTSYKITINNTGSNPITVKAKRLTKTYAQTKISAGKSAVIEFSNIQKDTEFYVTFDGQGFSVNGTVE